MEKTNFFLGETALGNEKKWLHRCIAIRLLTIFILFCTGCSLPGFVIVSPRVPEKYEVLGPAKGKACGLIMIDTPYVCAGLCTFMPINLNDRVNRAYQQALESVPGARALINVTMQEDQYWWVIGDAKCVTITGEAIR